MKRLFFTVLLIFCLGMPAHARMVYYNTGSGVWHNASCQHHTCKKCIKIEEDQARKRGGHACKQCRG